MNGVGRSRFAERRSRNQEGVQLLWILVVFGVVLCVLGLFERPSR
jgi:hypothetical protein